MLPKMLLFAALLLPAGVFLSGAWSSSHSPDSQSSESSFVPQPVPLGADLVGSGVDAKQLLKKALDSLAPERTTWLRTKVRQTMSDGECRFTAEGYLQRGPNQCARLEMELGPKHARGRLVMVSDGEVFVQVRDLAGVPPVAVLEKMPLHNRPARENFLIGKGCSGPLPLLRQFHQHMRNATLETGLLGGNAVIRIRGEIDGQLVPVMTQRQSDSVHAAVYLDAGTVWPHRFEWHGPNRSAPPLLQIELHDVELGRELSTEECSRTFSYQPGGNERVTEK